MMRGGLERYQREAHNLDYVRSNRTPATTPRAPLAIVIGFALVLAAAIAASLWALEAQ